MITSSQVIAARFKAGESVFALAYVVQDMGGTKRGFYKISLTEAQQYVERAIRQAMKRQATRRR